MYVCLYCLLIIAKIKIHCILTNVPTELKEIFDPRCALCRKEVGEVSNLKGIVCDRCKSYCVCHSCNTLYKSMHRHQSRLDSQRTTCDYLLNKRRVGKLNRKTLPSFSIAVKENVFGEGAERIVRKVRFINENGSYFGIPMVAKESRFVGMVQ